QQVLEELFPGLEQELVAAGAVRLDAADDIAWLTPAGWGVRFRSGLSMLSAGRDLLEWGVRLRVAQLPRVRFLEEVDVTCLLTDAATTAVTGVALLRRPAGGAAMPEELEADLVVDASGRGSRAPQWLEALGYGRPEETVVDSHLSYASRLYRC